MTILRSTAVCLVLLRFAIGYHFFTEGFQKLRNTWRGKTTTSKPFSSEGYFRAATGPLGPLMRERLGDPDDQALALFDVKPLPADADPTKVVPGSRIPAALDAEWNAYFDRFVEYYKLDDNGKKQAKAKLDQAKDKVVEWMTNSTETKKVKRTFNGKSDEITLTVPQRVYEYRHTLEELRELPRKRWELGRDVDREAAARLRAAATQFRTELLEDLDKQTADMKKALGEVVKGRADATVVYVRKNEKGEDPKDVDETLLSYVQMGQLPAGAEKPTAEQLPEKLCQAWQNYLDALVADFKLPEDRKKLGQEKLAEFEARAAVWLAEEQGLVKKYAEQVAARKGLPESKDDPQGKSADEALKKTRAAVLAGLQDQTNELKQYLGGALLNEYQRKAEAPPPPETRHFVWYLDRVTEWGLTILGACLMIGLLTRTSCLLCALFLLTTYFFAPAWPWLPMAPQTEGNPLFVNKNIIEMLALVTLATTASGLWFGVDAVIHALFPRKKPEVRDQKSEVREPIVS
jgi:uncharacterized membrane protein YphA (DoxX/SURF4 family)